MKLNDYQNRAAETAIYKDKLYPVMSLGIEAAEVADLFVKPVLRGDKAMPTRGQITAEAGDCLWMLANLLRDHGITLEECAQYNLDKLQDRKERGVLQGSGDNR